MKIGEGGEPPVGPQPPATCCRGGSGGAGLGAIGAGLPVLGEGGSGASAAGFSVGYTARRKG